jgi:tetratricopeptide (TPR) repeat protein
MTDTTAPDKTGETGKKKPIEPAETRSGDAGAPHSGGPGDPEGEPPPTRFSLEVMADNAAQAITQIKDHAQYYVDRGRYNKIRIKRGGKAILPDIPLSALMAVEAATFFWGGLLRGAIVNVVGRVLFEVELISDAEESYKRGLEHFLAGDLDDAEEALKKALQIDGRYARAHLQMGVLRKIQGRKAEAMKHFDEAVSLDENGDAGREAAIHLKKMREL